jgi:hypothetical protein
MAATQNSHVVTGDTLSISIKSAHVRKLTLFSRATGYPLSEVMDRAIDIFMNIEAPVYLEHAKQEQRQKA